MVDPLVMKVFFEHILPERKTVRHLQRAVMFQEGYPPTPLTPINGLIDGLTGEVEL